MKYAGVVVVLITALSLSTQACAPAKKTGNGGGREPASSATVKTTSKASDDEQRFRPSTGGTNGRTSDVPVTGALLNGECYKADPGICKVEVEILRLVNEERAKPTNKDLIGLLLGRTSTTPLRFGKKLGYVARDWSTQEARQGGSISHEGFPDARNAAFEKEFGYRPTILAENIALSFLSDNENVSDEAVVRSIAKQFFTMWYNSDGHYKNMVGRYNVMGVGVAHANGRWVATQIFGNE